MSQQHSASATTPGEEIVLVHVAMIMLGAVVASAGALWLAGAQWLVDHHVIVAARLDPLLVIPGTGGAGLDLARVFIGAGVLLAVMVIATSWLVNRVRLQRVEG